MHARQKPGEGATKPVKSRDSAFAREITIILKALVSTALSCERCEAGEPGPGGRTVLHQAVDEGFVVGQEFRCDKKGLCMMEDAQLLTGFVGQL